MRRRTGKGKKRHTGRVCVCSALSNANGALHCLRYTIDIAAYPRLVSLLAPLQVAALHYRTAIYSRIPGSKFENLTETGPVINTTFLFGNRAFPIHALKFLEESTLCWRGAYYPYRTSSDDPWLHWSQFQPIPTGAAPDYDMIL